MKKPIFESKRKLLSFEDDKIEILKVVNYFNYLLDKHGNKTFKNIDVNCSRDNRYYTVEIRFFDEERNSAWVDVMDFYQIEKVNNLINFVEEIFKGKYKTLESIKFEYKRITSY